MKKFLELTALSVILLGFVGGFTSCKKDPKPIEELSPAEIRTNLAKQETHYDPAFLIGTWDVVKFAYTPDGIYISDLKTKHSGTLIIDDENRWVLDYVTNEWQFFRHVHEDKNVLSLNFTGGYIIYPLSHNEIDMFNALMFSYGFVIRHNELIICFGGGTRDNDDGNPLFSAGKKNLLILKKK